MTSQAKRANVAGGVFCRGKGGDLVVSGILATQAWKVFKAAASNGLGFTKVVKKGKWVTAHGGYLTDLIAAGK